MGIRPVERQQFEERSLQHLDAVYRMAMQLARHPHEASDLVQETYLRALRVAANYEELSEQLRRRVLEQVDDEYGLDVPKLFIVNISFPEEVEKALDAAASMSVLGDMGRYRQYQLGKAMAVAADNPAGGGAAEGL